MKGVKMLGNRKLKVKDFPDPKAHDDMVVVAVKASILCGSDLRFLYRVDSKDAWSNNKFIPGHEIAGDVVDVDRTSSLKIGDRVAVYPIIGCMNCFSCINNDWKTCKNQKIIGYDMNGGHAEFVLVPERNLIPIPDDISYISAALLWDGIGVTYEVIKKLMVSQQDIVAVFGCGPIGLGAINNCKFKNATVIAIDILNNRLDLAKKIGANYTINPEKVDLKEEIKKITSGFGPDVCLECTGIEKVLHQVLDIVKQHGRCGLIGEQGKVRNFDIGGEIIHRELTIVGGLITDHSDVNELINMLRNGLDVEKIVTHKFNLIDSEEAWELFDQGKTGKVAIVTENINKYRIYPPYFKFYYQRDNIARICYL
jgi:threonine dehydrogenase-like Zn-dependent dehydrogenase